jgi:type I restriction-modification system DNA methylase subunit
MAAMLPAGVETVLEPTPGQGNLVKALEEQGYQVTAPKDFWSVSGRFDAVVMNPPFSPMAQGYQILFAVMEMSDVVIALMPWLTLINAKGRTETIRQFGLRSVTHLPRDAFPGSRVQTCILYLDKGYLGPTTLTL